MKKSKVAALALILLLLGSAAWAQQRHDSVVMVVDVSQSVGVQDQVTEAKNILQDMNRRFPNYVQDAGVMVFGNQQPPTTEWMLPVRNYDRQAVAGALASVQKGDGPTPIGFSLKQAAAGVDQARGKTALIIVSDGRDNGHADPVGVVREMKQKHGANLCVFTIQLGDNARGDALLSELVSVGQCGKTSRASALRSDSEVQALVDYIFPGVDAPPPPPPPSPTPLKDSDGDGVPDIYDECPGTPRGAKVDARGCWVLEDVHFDSGSAAIKPKYHAELDNVVAVLKKNPGVKIVVEGHTDSQGSLELNQRLSQQRAEAVMNYLIGKGVDPDQLSAVGYGPARPIADNDTAEGRAQNRRIELQSIE